MHPPARDLGGRLSVLQSISASGFFFNVGESLFYYNECSQVRHCAVTAAHGAVKKKHPHANTVRGVALLLFGWVNGGRAATQRRPNLCRCLASGRSRSQVRLGGFDWDPFLPHQSSLPYPLPAGRPSRVAAL